MDLSFFTKVGRTSKSSSTSDWLLSLPRVIRMLPWANSAIRPIAKRTCEGSKEAEEQALPLDAYIPEKSRPSNIGYPSTSSNEMLTLFGSLFIG